MYRGGKRREALIEHPQWNIVERGLSEEGGAQTGPPPIISSFRQAFYAAPQSILLGVQDAKE